MILKKPYAFLIKHFKLLHLILALLLTTTIYSSTKIVTFFNEYLGSPKLLTNLDDLGLIFPLYVFIIPFIIIMFCIVMLFVMYNKKKPYLLYILIILLSITTLGLYGISYNTITGMEAVLGDIRTIRIIRDLFTILIVANSTVTLFTLMRATGFDIKKFNFVKDLQDLDISEKDNE